MVPITFNIVGNKRHDVQSVTLLELQLPPERHLVVDLIMLHLRLLEQLHPTV